MPQPLAAGIVALFGLYFVAGFAFALAFATSGVKTVQPKATDSGWGFRALIVPGSLALWPYLAMRWLRAANGQGKAA
jgi:hypothetical protein